MKFTFFHLMPYDSYSETNQEWPVRNRQFDAEKAGELYDSYLDTMVYSEECGYDWIGCNEHHFSPYGLMANPNLIAAILAKRTTKSKIAVLGNLIPLSNPVRVAEEYAMLDVLSGGRLIAGFMRGIPHEYIAYNKPPSASRELLREATEIILRAWTEPEPFGWEGEHFQYKSISIWPRPFQKPHPRILMSAGSEESAATAAEYKAMMGIVLISDLDLARHNIKTYKDTAKSFGWEPAPDDIMVGQHCCIAETDEEARELLEAGAEYFNNILLAVQRRAQGIVLQKTRYYKDEKLAENFAKRLKKVRGTTVEEAVERGMLLCGSPESVVKQIKRLNNELGNGMLQMTMKVGNIPNEAVRKGMELFKARVLPEVRNL
jgi:alkanesulfonate monooxygenase SsuD/methylene tetrahydromethanopterin reductase-like flavin-dependent oxidoreductase (luciferase family)